jgi:hypothetical protein
MELDQQRFLDLSQSRQGCKKMGRDVRPITPPQCRLKDQALQERPSPSSGTIPANFIAGNFGKRRLGKTSFARRALHGSNHLTVSPAENTPLLFLGQSMADLYKNCKARWRVSEHFR